jgi:hypothetical protein
MEVHDSLVIFVSGWRVVKVVMLQHTFFCYNGNNYSFESKHNSK